MAKAGWFKTNFIFAVAGYVTAAATLTALFGWVVAVVVSLALVVLVAA